MRRYLTILAVSAGVLLAGCGVDHPDPDTGPALATDAQIAEIVGTIEGYQAAAEYVVIRGAHYAHQVNLGRYLTAVFDARQARLAALAAQSYEGPSGGGGGGGCADGDFACIRNCESTNNYGAVSSSGTYRGAYQFDQGTWESVGGTGDPAQAPPGEQDARARQLYESRGSSPWPNCG